MVAQHKLLALLAMAHLSLAALGAAAVPMGASDDVPMIEWYRHFTGTDNSFSFFAPGVAPQERVVLVCEDRQGNTWTESLRIGSNHEANLCFETVSFVISSADDRTAWNMLQSVARSARQRNPDIVSVTARVEAFGAVWKSDQAGLTDADSFDFPRMQEYRSGTKPQWLPMYEVKFQDAADQLVARSNVERD